MKFYHRKRFWVILAIILIPTAIFALKGKKSGTEEYVMAKVAKGDLQQTVAATGKVESASATNLNFRASGSLYRIYVASGQTVKARQLLAQLSAGASVSSVASARAQLAQAEADLLKIKAGSSNEDIGITEARVAQAEAELLAAQEALANAEAEQERNIISLKEQALNKASESLFLAKSSLEDADALINNIDYRHDLAYLNFSLGVADRADEAGVVAQNDLAVAITKYTVNSEIESLTGLMDLTDGVLKKVDATLSAAYELLSKVAPGNNLTASVITTFKSTISADQSSIATKIAAVQTAKANLQTKIAEYETKITTGLNAVKKAEASVAVAEAELALKQAGPRDFELKLYQAKVDQARASLNKAFADLSDYSLTAPVAGIITKVNYEVGELVTSANPVISLIGASNLQIKVDVPEADIAKIKAGDSAQITLDAFGNDRIFSGHVTFVDPAETIINDVVYYKITVTFDQKEADVKSGMTANVIVMTASRSGVLYLPSRAVLENGSKRYVKYLTSLLEVKEKEVTTGLRADDGLIEIISGLEEGEEVISYTKAAK